MHQIRFRLGLCPRPRWGAYSALPDPLARFKEPTSKRREGRGHPIILHGLTPLLIAPPVLRPHQVGLIALFPRGWESMYELCCAIVLVVVGSTGRCVCVLRCMCSGDAREGCEWLDGVFRGSIPTQNYPIV